MQLAAATRGAAWSTDWRATVRRDNVDVVFIATTHDQLAPIAAEAASAGKHVLIEKPGARAACELDAVADAAARTGALVRVGFNHRYHRAFRKAREIFETGALGEMMFIRGRYGHGGRPGYDREWRAVPALSGGGELVDQGVHLIDLSRWFLGDFLSCAGPRPHIFLGHAGGGQRVPAARNRAGQVAFLHASWTEWKNLFSFEIAGRVGKLEITGLGGSYGTERLTWYKMSPEMGPPETPAWEYPMADDSWHAENADFFEDIRLGRQPDPGIADAQAMLRVVESITGDRLPRDTGMIITRSPLRISLGGGGTDLPSYYREHGGFVISAAIDKYVYITLHETFQPEFLIKYSAMETVQTVDEIKHPIIREALRMVPVSAPHLEIVSMSDIPAGTGLGSSGSFTVALLRALHTLNKEFVPRQDLAEQACHIEIDILGEPIGKQDQYIASFGGITCFEFHPDGRVDVAPLQISTETLYNLEDNLLLFFTGFTRSASAILAEQDQRPAEATAG